MNDHALLGARLSTAVSLKRLKRARVLMIMMLMINFSPIATSTVWFRFGCDCKSKSFFDISRLRPQFLFITRNSNGSNTFRFLTDISYMYNQ